MAKSNQIQELDNVDITEDQLGKDHINFLDTL